MNIANMLMMTIKMDCIFLYIGKCEDFPECEKFTDESKKCTGIFLYDGLKIAIYLDDLCEKQLEKD